MAIDPSCEKYKRGIAAGRGGFEPGEVAITIVTREGGHFHSQGQDIKRRGLIQADPDMRPICAVQPPATVEEVLNYEARITEDRRKVKQSFERSQAKQKEDVKKRSGKLRMSRGMAHHQRSHSAVMGISKPRVLKGTAYRPASKIMTELAGSLAVGRYIPPIGAAAALEIAKGAGRTFHAQRYKAIVKSKAREVPPVSVPDITTRLEAVKIKPAGEMTERELINRIGVLAELKLERKHKDEDDRRRKQQQEDRDMGLYEKRYAFEPSKKASNQLSGLAFRPR